MCELVLTVASVDLDVVYLAVVLLKLEDKVEDVLKDVEIYVSVSVSRTVSLATELLCIVVL